MLSGTVTSNTNVAPREQSETSMVGAGVDVAVAVGGISSVGGKGVGVSGGRGVLVGLGVRVGRIPVCRRALVTML